MRATSAYKLHRIVRGRVGARGCHMSKGDSFSGESRVSDPASQQQLDQLYDDLETRLFEAVADFGIDELHEILEAANTIRARRPA